MKGAGALDDGNPQALQGEHGKAGDDANHAEQAPLFGKRGEHEVGMDYGDIDGRALPDALPEYAACRERKQALDDLEGAPVGFRPGVKPDVDAKLDDIEQTVGDNSGDANEQRASDEQGRVATGDVEQHEKDHEKEDRCA